MVRGWNFKNKKDLNKILLETLGESLTNLTNQDDEGKNGSDNIQDPPAKQNKTPIQGSTGWYLVVLS